MEGKCGATGLFGFRGLLVGARRGQSVTLLSSSLPSAWFHSVTWIPGPGAGTSFYPLGCQQWLGQGQEVGTGAPIPNLPLWAM